MAFASSLYHSKPSKPLKNLKKVFWRQGNGQCVQRRESVRISAILPVLISLQTVFVGSNGPMPRNHQVAWRCETARRGRRWGYRLFKGAAEVCTYFWTHLFVLAGNRSHDERRQPIASRKSVCPWTWCYVCACIRACLILLPYIWSGQIIATSHDLTPKIQLRKGNPLISRISRLVKYCNLARYDVLCRHSSI